MSAVDEMYSHLMNAGGLTGQAFAQGQDRFQNQQLGAQQLQIGQAKLADDQRQRQQAQQYQADLAAYNANPTPSGIGSLIAKYPQQAQALKAAHDAQDEPVKQSRLANYYTMYNLAKNGRADGVTSHIDGLIAAEKAQGLDTADAEGIREALKSPDEAVRQRALTDLQAHTQGMISIADPERARALGLLADDKGFTLDAGAVRYDGRGNVVARSPFLKDAAGNVYEATGEGGDSSSGGARATRGLMSPKATAVAAALSSAGLPPAVVAGFMGNFHVEGGYDGAQGDGGSASGIAQWHKDRADTFQRVIGKSVTEATPEEQAKFVAWEMQNPVAAGMTVAKRDAILRAKTPAQAAALIDQHYERSSGRDRNVRMSAATAFAGQYGAATTEAGGVPGYRRLTPDKPKDAPSGYRWNGNNLEPIPGGPADKGGATDTPSIGDTTKTGAAYLATLPTNVSSQVKALSEGRIPLPSSFAVTKPYWQKLLQATAQYDPTFDAANAKTRFATRKEFTSGKAAANITSFNTALGHLETLAKAADGLHNRAIPLWNRVANSFESGKGDPALTRFNVARQALASELTRAFRGTGGSLAEVKDWESSIASSGSPEQLHAAVKQAAELLASRVNALGEQYNAGMGRSSQPINLLDPHARTVLQRYTTDKPAAGTVKYVRDASGKLVRAQ